MTVRPALLTLVIALAGTAVLVVALDNPMSSVLVLIGVVAVGVLAIDRDQGRHHHR